MPVSGGRAHLPQHHVVVLRVELFEGDREAALIGEHEFAVGVGGPLVHRVADRLVLGVGREQLELRPAERRAVLVDLADAAFRNGDEVVFQTHVRVGVAAFQIVEIERVVGIVGEGGAGELRRVRAGGGERVGQRGLLVWGVDARVVRVVVVPVPVHGHRAGGKVDFER